MVWVHGGGWTIGSKDDLPIRGWTDHGFAVASLSYRYATDPAAPGARDPDGDRGPMADVDAAVAFLATNATALGVDASRIALFGHSAGAQLAALTALTGGAPVAALVGVAGPHDLTDTGLPLAAGTEDAVVALLGGCRPATCPERAVAASPVHHAHGGAPPTLLVHGTDDDVVDPRHSEALHDALVSAGAPAELALLPGGDHRDLALGRVRTFLETHLRPAG